MGEMNRLSWQLNDPGLGFLEKAGLAGLYMTLQAAGDRGVSLDPLSFELDAGSVSLSWEGKDKEALMTLVRFAWQAPEDVLYLPGVHREERQRSRSEYRLTIHNGILGTFLQHNKVQPRSKVPVKGVVELDENRLLRFSYNPLTKGKGIRPVQDVEAKFFNKGTLKPKGISLSSWISPGSAGRYKTEKAWAGSAEQALLLLFAPVACFYHRFYDNWVLVIPDIKDLAEYDRFRLDWSLDPAGEPVASLGDAGLRFAAEYSARSIQKELEVGCHIVAMGRVQYYNKTQSVRKGVMNVRPTLKSVVRYQRILSVFGVRYIPPSGKNHDEENGKSGWFKVPEVRGRIAANIVEEMPWYSNLTFPPTWEREALEKQRQRMKKTDNGAISLEKLWFDKIRKYFREGLMELAGQRDMWDSEEERALVDVVQHCLAALYAKEAEATKRGGSRTLEERLEDLNEDLRRGLMRTKTRDLLRAFMTEFFAKAGRRRSIQENASVIWNLINHPREWKKARDLTLLALVSYAGKNNEKEAKEEFEVKEEQQ